MKSALDATYQRYTDSLHDIPIALQQDLHLYICIRLSGYLEQLLHQAICAYVSDSSNSAAREFTLSFFRNAPNLNPGALEKLIERFGDKWVSELGQLLDLENNRTSLGTLIKIRNDTAHGRSYGGSLASISSYKELIDDLHKWVLARMID
ncbi:HEPN domain-containing protein [Nocardia altamirensis]|uniref:HEPN domain-containing protein n=1 Tax=Nocardia altamirensis TaxID=472158 RepID=UPI00114CAE23|nr:HEPN domain-containing protein [Nocardia altamirensis]